MLLSHDWILYQSCPSFWNSQFQDFSTDDISSSVYISDDIFERTKSSVLGNPQLNAIKTSNDIYPELYDLFFRLLERPNCSFNV